MLLLIKSISLRLLCVGIVLYVIETINFFYLSSTMKRHWIIYKSCFLSSLITLYISLWYISLSRLSGKIWCFQFLENVSGYVTNNPTCSMSQGLRTQTIVSRHLACVCVEASMTVVEQVRAQTQMYFRWIKTRNQMCRFPLIPSTSLVLLKMIIQRKNKKVGKATAVLLRWEMIWNFKQWPGKPS